MNRYSAIWLLHVELTRFDRATLNSTSSASDLKNESPAPRELGVSNLLVHFVQESAPLHGYKAPKYDEDLLLNSPSKSIATIRASLVGVAESQTPSVQRIAEPANEVSIRWFNA